MFKFKGPVLAVTMLDKASGEAIRQACAIARAAKSRLVVCHVLPELVGSHPLFPQRQMEDVLRMDGLLEKARQAVEKQVENITRGKRGLAVSIRIEHGTPHGAVLKLARKLSPGLIVVNAQEIGSGLLGGPSERILRYASCPVLMTRTSPAGKVLAATDFSDPTLPAIEAAASESPRRKVPLVVMHVLETVPVMTSVFESGMLWPMPEVPIHIRETLQKRLDDCARRIKAKRAMLVDGLPAESIVSAARELPAELLVVATHGRTGFSHTVLGSVAEDVVRYAPCSVLVVRLSKRS